MNDTINPSTDVVTLTRQLVSIPSYVDKQNDETRIIEFIAHFFRKYLPALHIEKQPIENGSERSNLVIKGKSNPHIFFLGHIDTVQPTDSWSTPPLEPHEIDGKLYGLGAADMKGSLAAFLCALTNASPECLEHIMILLYVDEEYNFQGTKRFLKDQTLTEHPPKLIISLDGSLDLASGCRGLIEFSARINGKSGHASDPSNGNNVIMGTATAVKNLEEYIKRYKDQYLGESTLNLAYMQAGIVERRGEEVFWLREGNVIPDSADITLEVRTSSKELDGKKTREQFIKYIKEQGLSVTSIVERHDFGPWDVSYDSPLVSWFEDCYKQAGISFSISDRKLSGFIDVQMITEVIDCPTFVIGAGGNNKHGSDENIEIKNLTEAEKLYLIILNKCGELHQ